MKNPVVAVSSLLALTLVGPVVAQIPQVVDGPPLVATGTVISVGNTSMAIQTHDHGHAISFIVSTTTVMPTLVSVGSRVRVAYHAIGTTGQMADRVTLLEGPTATSSVASEFTSAASEFTGASGVQPAAPANQPGTPATELPATASPLTLIGLVGLIALLAGVSLRALERARASEP